MDADQLDDPVLYRQELIKTHSRRLKALEIKASKYGLECPVSIKVEITEIKEKIATLGGEIDEVAEHHKFLAELETLGKAAREHRKLQLQYDLDRCRHKIEWLNVGTYTRLKYGSSPNIEELTIQAQFLEHAIRSLRND